LFTNSSTKSAGSGAPSEDIILSKGDIISVLGIGIGGTTSAFCAMNWKEIL
jgi:hypothetical protein